MPPSTIKGISLIAPVTLDIASDPQDAVSVAKPVPFESTFYTGGALEIEGWELPVVVDLAGLERGNILVANLDHSRSQRVGNFDVANNGQSLIANGTALPEAFPAAKEVVLAARGGYRWQASLEVTPKRKGVEQIAAGKEVEVNGQTFTGPLYVTRKGVLKGFAFVSHGADDNTTATIAATAASKKEKGMKPEVKAWAEDMGIDVDNATPEQVAIIEANYAGRNCDTKKKKVDASDPFAARKLEAKRRKDIRDIADRMIEARNSEEEEIVAIEKMCEHAIGNKEMTATEFRLELYESTIPEGRTVAAPSRRGDTRLTNAVLEAAICQAGRLEKYEDQFDDQTLQLAHDRFKGRISLGQLFMLGAEAAGYRGDYASKVTPEVQNAAFGLSRQIHGAGFSTVVIPTIISNTANKFLMVGWNSVDMTPLRIAAIKTVNDFKEITTVSLTGDLQFEKVGAAGEIKHGTLGELTYTNKADTYAKMLAITRQDIINDDLGALTSVPRRLGRGSALKLNDIFWTAFLDNSSFFTSGNANVNTGVADMTSGGLAATDVIFMNQTDPDGKPLGVMPAIILVPTALKTGANQLMTSEKIKGDADEPDGNVWRGRFRVESSPYMSNSAYTGYSAVAWYLLADPNDLPVIEIAALFGRVEPVVETADAAFNVLGVEMRGYSDVGVRKQEYRGGVRADGGSS